MQKLFFIPDCHVPYHHKRNFRLMLKALQAFKPDRVIIGGDFGDCFCISDHDKNPERSRRLDWELGEIKKALKEVISAAPEATFDYCEGNHENRLDRYLMRKAPELYGLCRYKDLMEFKNLGIRFHEYRKHMTIGKLNVTHDCGNAGAYAHIKAQSMFQGNVVINHTHRIGYAIVGSALGKPHVGAMFGHLSDADEIDYAHRIQVTRDWAYGFGHGYMDEATGYVHLVPDPIVGNQVVIEGKVIKG